MLEVGSVRANDHGFEFKEKQSIAPSGRIEIETMDFVFAIDENLTKFLTEGGNVYFRFSVYDGKDYLESDKILLNLSLQVRNE